MIIYKTSCPLLSQVPSKGVSDVAITMITRVLTKRVGIVHLDLLLILALSMIHLWTSIYNPMPDSLAVSDI